MFAWFLNADSFHNVHASGESVSSIVISGGSVSNVVVSSGDNSKAEVRGSHENDTLNVSLAAGSAYIYPGAGDDIIWVSGGATKNIDDAPVNQNGSVTNSDSGDDTYYFSVEIGRAHV